MWTLYLIDNWFWSRKNCANSFFLFIISYLRTPIPTGSLTSVILVTPRRQISASWKSIWRHSVVICKWNSNWWVEHFNTLTPTLSGRNFTNDISKCIFLDKNWRILIHISLKLVPKGPVINIIGSNNDLVPNRSQSEPILVSWTDAYTYHSALYRWQFLLINDIYSVFAQNSIGALGLEVRK